MTDAGNVLPFGPLLAILAAATVVGVGSAVVFHLTLLVPVVLVAAIAVGLVLVLLTVPKLPTTPAESGTADADEPFEDPVEEADRLDASGASEPASADEATGEAPATSASAGNDPK